MNMKKLSCMVILSAAILSGCSDRAKEIPFTGELSHVHGIGYASNNNGLYFAAHTGLKIYREGNWFAISSNFFDFMGFNAIDKGFYTSGHPSADSDMPNPLGIQRSLDGGNSLEHVAFEGETDFHLMAVGYISHDIFLLNPQANSELAAGFYKRLSNDNRWQPVITSGLEGEVSSLALHPSDSNIVAAATSAGVYLSKDGGRQFERLTHITESGTAVFINENELFYASYGTTARLTKYTVATKKEVEVNLPKLIQGEIAFISQNPANEDEIGLYTIQGDAFLTENYAKTWNALLNDGIVK